MSFKNDRLDFKQDRKSIKINIPLDFASTSTPKILQKKEIDGICINDDSLCLC